MSELLLAAGVSAKTAGTIAAVGQAMTLAAATVGAVGAYQQSRTQGAIAEAEAERQEVASRDAAVTAGLEAERQRKRQRLLASRNLTAFAEAGSLSGSAFDVLNANDVASEMDALTVEYQGERQSAQLMDQAAISRANAAGYNAAAPVSAGARLIGGVGSVAANVDPLNFGEAG